MIINVLNRMKTPFLLINNNSLDGGLQKLAAINVKETILNNSSVIEGSRTKSMY